MLQGEFVRWQLQDVGKDGWRGKRQTRDREAMMESGEYRPRLIEPVDCGAGKIGKIEYCRLA